MEEFTKPKIIYQDIAQSLPFYLNHEDHFYFNNTLWMLAGREAPLPYLAAVLNSSIFFCCFKDDLPEYSGNAYRLFSIFIVKIPIKKPTAGQAALFEKLVPFVQHAKRISEDTSASFLEDLIDACVMDCSFRKHMAERDLLFHDTLAPHLAAYAPEASAAQ